MNAIKSLILLSVVLPFCLAIEVKLYNKYGNGIKKVEIPSCQVEPCALVKGTPLNISITVESRYPHEQKLNKVADLQSSVDIAYYRNRFIYELAQTQRYCKQQPNECPVKLNKVYTINRQLFLSKDIKPTEHSAMGSENGKHNANVLVTMMANDNVSIPIGNIGFMIDIKPN